MPDLTISSDILIQSALATLNTEAEALEEVMRAVRDTDLGVHLAQAAMVMASGTGRVVLCGMGKSGIVARKIASTLASTGTPALFLHPAEAGHGDLGMLAGNDVVLALSWSGETAELVEVVNYTRRFKIPLIAITANLKSALAARSDLCLTLPQVREACPHRLAPTSSATVQMVIGDALALALVQMRGFSMEDFRTLHPRGKLGARLLMVGDLMSAGADIPLVGEHATVLDAAVEISSKRLGATAIVNDTGDLIGAFTDGDLRRSLTTTTLTRPVVAHMTTEPVTVSAKTLASEALMLMNERSIMQLFVCEGRRLIGVLHIHEVLRAQVA